MISQMPSRRPRTKLSTGAALLLGGAALLILAMFWALRRSPPRGPLPHLGPILVHVETYETNDFTGEITAGVAIENHSDQALDFVYGVQLRVAKGGPRTR